MQLEVQIEIWSCLERDRNVELVAAVYDEVT